MGRNKSINCVRCGLLIRADNMSNHHKSRRCLNQLNSDSISCQLCRKLITKQNIARHTYTCKKNDSSKINQDQPSQNNVFIQNQQQNNHLSNTNEDKTSVNEIKFQGKISQKKRQLQSFHAMQKRFLQRKTMEIRQSITYPQQLENEKQPSKVQLRSCSRRRKVFFGRENYQDYVAWIKEQKYHKLT